MGHLTQFAKNIKNYQCGQKSCEHFTLALFLSCIIKFSLGIAEKLLVKLDPGLYHFINQGCLDVDGMDDKVEMKLTDVCRNTVQCEPIPSTVARIPIPLRQPSLLIAGKAHLVWGKNTTLYRLRLHLSGVQTMFALKYFS